MRDLILFKEKILLYLIIMEKSDIVEIKPVFTSKCLKPLYKDHRVINGKINTIPLNVSNYIFGKF